MEGTSHKVFEPARSRGRLRLSLVSSALAAAAFLFSGCVIKPQGMKSEVAAELGGGFVNSPTGVEGEADQVQNWWLELESASIEALVGELLTDNLSVKEAAERVEQSLGRLAAQSGGKWPSVFVEAGKGRSFGPSPLDDGSRVYSNQKSVDLGVAWQADLFGKIRQSENASEASFWASEADRNAIEQSLVAELSRRLLAHETNLALLELAQANRENRREFLELVKRRYDMGSVSVSLNEVYLAREAYTSVESEVAEFDRLIAENLYHIDVLLGDRPGATDLAAMDFSFLETELPEVPSVYPAYLLDYRPDLAAADFRVQAAEANVKVAVADLYPSLGISAGLGLSDADLDDLFDLDDLVGSLFASLTQPLFQGGSLKANVRIQESALRESAYSYEGKVLNAVREVETALQGEKQIRLSYGSQELSLEALQQAEIIAEKRYSDGLQSLQSFLDTQRRRYIAEQSLVLTRQQLWNTRFDLYLSLGGKIPANT